MHLSPVPDDILEYREYDFCPGNKDTSPLLHSPIGDRNRGSTVSEKYVLNSGINANMYSVSLSNSGKFKGKILEL